MDGDPIPIVGIDTGPDTNIDAGEPLVFSSQPPGVSVGAVVLAQNDGTGNPTVRMYYKENATVSGTTWSYTDTRTLTNTQAVGYKARAADAAGNQSNAGTAYSFTVDPEGARRAHAGEG